MRAGPANWTVTTRWQQSLLVCEDIGSRVSAGAAAAVDAPAASVPSMGPDLWNRTYYPSGSDANPLIKPWYVVDAEGQTLGRLATMVAMHLRCAAG